ncbi:MAG: exopolyphosphatase [Hahellaceae bacterium]|nr:exopolyphosphatase [Hahellaceae bacterium]MCP5168186.1 exopolyphosphatase [Hahellaceae bacterium]
MIVGRTEHGEVRPIDKLGEKVQLAAGLNSEQILSEEAQQRGLECLSRFAQRIKGLPQGAVQVVGTNALRIAKNSQTFIERAEAVLGHPVEIIAGREEARLIYLGVSHLLADDDGNRLVIDIGGGSTEFIIGERFEAKALESLHMGCVSYRERFFENGDIAKENLKKAITQASRELLNIKKSYRKLGWTSCVGSSGSIKAVLIAAKSIYPNKDELTPQVMNHLLELLPKLSHIDKLTELGIKKERCSIFPAGFAILYACFEVLGIERMTFSDGALREGLIYDMLGRIQHEDVRERSISAMQERYHVDKSHALAVEQTALYTLQQVAKDWCLTHSHFAELLRWSCRLHEVGLMISHTQYHKHGAYIIQHSDMAGFSKQTQIGMAILIRGHRRKIIPEIFVEAPPSLRQHLIKLSVLMRLAALFNHSRTDEGHPEFTIKVDKARIELFLSEDWLQENPLTRADLEAEANYLNRIGFKLSLN